MQVLENVTACLSKLPGVGRKTAERMAVHLVRDPEGLLADLAVALEDARRTIRCCSLCGNVTSVREDPCRLCTSARRDAHVLCVVQEPGDILLIEHSGGFHGRYHALMGKLSPMKGQGARHLRIEALVQRVRSEAIREVVLALSTDVEGDATAAYLVEVLRDLPVQVTRLAFGLPAGSGVMYSDPVTLARAFSGRREA
jgi:recombination protein RecR